MGSPKRKLLQNGGSIPGPPNTSDYGSCQGSEKRRAGPPEPTSSFRTYVPEIRPQVLQYLQIPDVQFVSLGNKAEFTSSTSAAEKFRCPANSLQHTGNLIGIHSKGDNQAIQDRKCTWTPAKGLGKFVAVAVSWFCIRNLGWPTCFAENLPSKSG